MALCKTLEADYSRYKTVCAELEPLPEISHDELEAYRHAHDRIRFITGTLKGAMLNVQIDFAPGTEGSFSISDGKGGMQDLPATALTAKMPGQVRIEHAGMTARITRPEIDAEALQEEGKNQKAAIDALEQRLTLTEAPPEGRLKTIERMVSQRTNLLREEAQLVKRIKERLATNGYGGMKLKAFMDECAGLNPSTYNEGNDHYHRLCKRADDERDICRRTKNEADRQLKEFYNRWQSGEAIAQHKQELDAELAQLQTDLAVAPPLPSNLAQNLVAEYQQTQHRSLDLQRQLIQQKNDLAAAEEAISSIASSEELKGRIAKANTSFEYAKSKLKAARRLLTILESTLESLDLQSFQPFEDRLSHYLGLLTGGKYTQAALDQDNPVLPTGLMAGKHALTLEQLSKGTGDSLALALRLTMAELYLKEQQGFIVFDDPMVDLDPARAQAAASALQAFATKYQTLVLTCHPHLAAMLGGHLIEM